MNNQEVLIKMVTDAWNTHLSRMDKLLETLSDEQLSAATAPGRNTGVYLLGHLAAVNDGMLPLLGFGQKLYPELESVFLRNPENAGLSRPPLETLKQYWKEINARLSAHISSSTAEEWFTRHNAVSEEDFAREPHRNKLNILVNRTNHMSYHLGQLVYLNRQE